MSIGTTCQYCGSNSYGRGCPLGPNGCHIHLPDGKHCVYCGSTSKYGRGCPLGPNLSHCVSYAGPGGDISKPISRDNEPKRHEEPDDYYEYDPVDEENYERVSPRSTLDDRAFLAIFIGNDPRVYIFWRVAGLLIPTIGLGILAHQYIGGLKSIIISSCLGLLIGIMFNSLIIVGFLLLVGVLVWVGIIWLIIWYCN